MDSARDASEAVLRLLLQSLTIRFVRSYLLVACVGRRYSESAVACTVTVRRPLVRHFRESPLGGAYGLCVRGDWTGYALCFIFIVIA